MCVRTIKTMLFVLTCAAAMLFGAKLASADAVLVGQVNMKGTGFGNVNTHLTVQALGQGMGGTESGCVGLAHGGKQIYGPKACQGDNAGGNEKPPTGIGKSGWEFMLNSTQATEAQAAINAGFDLLGVSATISGASGGPETFFLINPNGDTHSPAPAPEPGTLLLFGMGLVLTGSALRRKEGRTE